MHLFGKYFFPVLLMTCSHWALSKSSPVIEGLVKPLNQLDESLNTFDNKNSTPSKGTVIPSKKSKRIHRDDNLGKNTSSSLLVLGKAYIKKRDYKNGARVLRKLKDKEVNDPEILMELARAFGNIYFKTGDFTYREDSVSLLNQVLDQKNRKYSESAQLEMLKLLKFKADGADNNYAILQLINKLIGDFGEKPYYISDLCKYLHLNQFHRQSVSACRKAINKNTDATYNYVYYAWSFKDNKKKEDHVIAAGKKFPESSFVQLQAGEFYRQQEDYSQALPYYEKVVSINPNSSEAQVGLASSLFHTNREIKSYKHFLKACKLNKTDTLWSFKQAKSILNQRSKFKLASQFDKGITKCFLNTK